MNERILELADKAIEDIPGAWNIPDEFCKKFAELIVAECIVTIQKGITRDGHNTEKYLRSMKHIKEIKEHFGVLE